MKYFVTDTHPLVWYITRQNRKLPQKVKQIFDGAVEGNATIWIPLIALWELALLIRAGKVELDISVEELVARNFFASNIYLLDLPAEDILNASQLEFSRDAFDLLIVASAQRMELPLITGDSVIHDHSPCKIYW